MHADPSAEPASAMAVNAHLTDMHGMQDRLREDRVESEAWRTSFPPPEEIPLWRY